eukprot:scaffold6615_cov172-Amphora_coffeaeformis.AAC.6
MGNAGRKVFKTGRVVDGDGTDNDCANAWSACGDTTRRGIFHDEAIIPPIIGFAECRLDTTLRGNTRDDQMCHTLQPCFEFGPTKGSLAGFVTGHFPITPGHGVDNAITGLSPHQHATFFTCGYSNDGLFWIPSGPTKFGHCQIVEIHGVRFEGVENANASLPSRLQDASSGGSSRPGMRCPSPASDGGNKGILGIQKVPLPINHEQGRLVGIGRQGKGKRRAVGNQKDHFLLFGCVRFFIFA